jgi:uncharacterized membrane protein YphA (DoxX/SURF4 family)
MPKPSTIVYWILTVIVAALLLLGGVSELMQPPDVAKGMERLGYPDYLMTILGTWKILGALVILAPRLPRLKEWAYAGIFFDLTGAAASHAFSRDYGPGSFHIIVPLVLAVILLISWWLRPASRKL